MGKKISFFFFLSLLFLHFPPQLLPVPCTSFMFLEIITLSFLLPKKKEKTSKQKEKILCRKTGMELVLFSEFQLSATSNKISNI